MTIIGKDYADLLTALRNDRLPGGFDPNLLKVVSLGRSLGLTDEKIREDLIDHTPERAGDRTKGIDRALSKAQGTKQKRDDEGNIEATIEVQPVKLPAPVQDEAWRPFLETLFMPDDLVLIAPGRWNAEKKKNEPDNERRERRSRVEWVNIFEAVEGPSGHFADAIGVYVVVNPGGAELADITRPEHFLLEMDAGSKEAQLGIIRAMGLPYVTLVDSAGKSIHAICRTKARTTDKLKAIAKQVYEITQAYTVESEIVELDDRNCSANRYTRLPGAWRGDKMQELLEVTEDPETVEGWIPGAKDAVLLAKLPGAAAGELWADTDPPPQDAILEPLFETADKVVIIGSSKARKTFFTMQMAISLAADMEAV